MIKNPIRSLITFSVCFVHLLFLFFIFFKSPYVPSKKQPIRVKTFVAQQTPITEKKAASPSPKTLLTKPHKSSPLLEKKVSVKKENPPLKKLNSAPEKNRRPTPKPAPSLKPQIPSVSSSLLQELEESIAKIQDKSDKPRLDKQIKNKTHLSTLTTLKIDTVYPEKVQSDKEDSSDYISRLTEYLHAALHLPDFGEVKIELTLHQDGTIAKLKVIEAQSHHNKKYLESHLPLLRFPRLTGSFAKENEYTFTVNFCNEP